MRTGGPGLALQLAAGYKVAWFVTLLVLSAAVCCAGELRKLTPLH